MDAQTSLENNRNLEQEKTRRIIIEDMVEKRHVIVPIIGDDTIVYQPDNSSEEIPFQKYTPSRRRSPGCSPRSAR